jgi:hypothetical protein
MEPPGVLAIGDLEANVLPLQQYWFELAPARSLAPLGKSPGGRETLRLRLSEVGGCSTELSSRANARAAEGP